MATIKDVARLAGVATSTVSRVLGGSPRISVETQERVRDAMRSLNYHPNAIARSLARRTTGTLGLIIDRPAEQAFTNPFFTEVIRGISSVIHAEGFNLLLVTHTSPQEGRKNCLQLLRQRRVDGVILAGSRVRDRLIDDLVAEGHPFVLIGRVLDDRPISWVNNDNEGIGAMATDHLIGCGHRRIAMISGPSEFVVTVDRRHGFEQSLRQAGVPLVHDYLREVLFTREGGYQAMSALLNLVTPPSAVFCGDDNLAVGALFCLRERGIPCGPGGIALIGVNDDPVSELVTPALSTVRIPVFDLGGTAARLLLDRLVRRSEAVPQVFLPGTLVVRDTSNWIHQER